MGIRFHRLGVIPKLERTPIKWRVMPEWFPEFGVSYGSIYVEARKNREGKTLYAVTQRERWELSKTGACDYAPLPSERDEHYFNLHRWSTLDEALAAAAEYALEEIKNHKRGRT